MPKNNSKTQYAALNQARTISVYRLYRKMGEMTRLDQKRVRSAFLRMHGKKIFPLPSDRGIVGVPKDKSIIYHLKKIFKALSKH